MKAELARDNDDIGALWTRLRESDLQISEWHGNTVYAFASTGPGASDRLSISSVVRKCFQCSAGKS
nr:hypothetical protein BDOA9_0206590 [Bradyrhizobium sp. DOA9]